MLHEDTHYNDRPYDTIYLDMHGVIADFHLEAVRTYMRVGTQFPELEHHGTPLQLSTIHFNRQWRKHFPGLSLQRGWLFGRHNKEDFWVPINKDPFFWANIDPYPWLKELISEVRSYCRHLVICTRPQATPDCHGGTASWLIRHKLYPQYELHTCIEKWRLAAPGCLLIDDHTKNVEDFNKAAKERGGEAFLFPGACNKMWQHSLDPVMSVVRFLDQKFQDLKAKRYPQETINANG